MGAALHQSVRAFFAALSEGAFPDGMLASDMTFWSLSGGEADRARFVFGISLLQSLFPNGLHYTPELVIAEGDRASAEVRSHGTLADGQTYQNAAVFTFRFSDGAIASLKEYQNVELVKSVLGPRMQAALAKARPG